MGREYDTPESRAYIEPFIDSFNLRDSLSEIKEPDPNKYATFDDLFALEIKDPADCCLTAFPRIDLATKYWIKGFGFTFEALLGDANLARQFEGGSIVIARLAPQDYHRWHLPVSGTVENIKDISAYYTVNPQAINKSGTLDVFCENKRSVMTVRRSATGFPIAIIAVGTMLVGSMQ